MRWACWLLVLAGCEQGADTDPAADTDEAVEPFAGAPLATLSDGDCPSMGRGGTKTFSSGGVDREIELILPDEVMPGMPALFVWHGLGDSAGSMASWMQLQRFADDRGMIVVVPESLDRSGNTWDFVSGGGLDLVLYDDLRTCLSDKLEVDLARVTTTGFSFGGLWATFLTLHRADTLATSLIMSGGTSAFFLPYETPAVQLPVLVMWGGADDTYGEGMTQVRFEETSLDFSERLREDGHLVAHCDHGLGHTVPDEIHDILGDWLDAHVYGEPSGLAGGLGSMPSWCSLP
jgi:predicted esterase